jgi:hypothetical protein
VDEALSEEKKKITAFFPTSSSKQHITYGIPGWIAVLINYARYIQYYLGVCRDNLYGFFDPHSNPKYMTEYEVSF